MSVTSALTTTTGTAAQATSTAACSNLYDTPVDDAVCGMPDTGNYTTLMFSCCGAADVVSYYGGCGLYCLAVGLLQKTWVAILDEAPWTFDGQRLPTLGVLDEFLPDVEAIIRLRGASPRRLFTFGADVLPYLALAGCLTEDLGLLRRIVGALRLLDRREGLWDSKDLAEIFEASIVACTEDGLAARGGARGILHMARTLSDMKIPCISRNNSIVLLARSMEQ
ncbi:hypothetical protein LQW54_003657 [Pestalotiopsis sp. IQ-011]